VGYGSPIPIYTMNPAVIDAWSRRSIETGDIAFDGIIMELTPPRSLDATKTDLGNGWYLFALKVQGTFNEHLLDERLRAVASHTEEPRYPYNDNGSWSWQGGITGTGSDSDIAQIDFSFGWGDCFVACDGMRDLRAIVSPDGDAHVYDLGGDPLPENLHLNASTTPWP
jgi:hypothetical protein